MKTLRLHQNGGTITHSTPNSISDSFVPRKTYAKLAICTSRQIERKQQLKENYERHIKNKELVRNIKQQEKETSNESVKTVACFDLEKVFLPQSEVGVFDYKRKYPVYNFTIYNILKKIGYYFLWHQIAKRGANEIASCLWLYLKSKSD